MSKMNFYRHVIKASLDRGIALGCLIVLFPVMVLIAIVLIFEFKGSPFFVQRRAGLKGKPFWLYKFRTFAIPGNDRSIPRVGKLLRRSSADEWPQLINILKGEMSFIGPRPLYVFYLPYYSNEEYQRHQVLPGLSGWAQVCHSPVNDWDQRLHFDIAYVQGQSFRLDFYLLVKTLGVVMSSAQKNKDEVQTIRLDALREKKNNAKDSAA